MQRFPPAPWPTLLKVTSAGATLLLASIALIAAMSIPARGLAGPTLVAVCGPVAIALGGALFMIRGYEIAPGVLRVQRLLWPTVIRLESVQRGWHDPEAMKCSIRLFGNGGLFSFSGLFRNQKLGRYRAFVTDPKRAVVLVLAKRVVVVTPENPDAFVQHLRLLVPGLPADPG